MNLEKLKEILNLNVADHIKEVLLLAALVEEKDIIPQILKLLNFERQSNEELIRDLNFELSRTHSYMIEAVMDKRKKGFSKDFVHSEIVNLYRKYRTKITHTYQGSKWGNRHLKDIYETKN